MKITFVYNSFWLGVYKNGEIVWQGDYVECLDVLKTVVLALGVNQQDLGTIAISDKEYDNYFESVGYPKYLDTFFKKIGRTA